MHNGIQTLGRARKAQRLIAAAGLLPALMAAATAPASMHHYYLPHVIDGNPAPHGASNGLLHAHPSQGSFETTFVLTNTGNSAANITIAASRDDASPLFLSIPGLGSGPSLTATLAAGATRLFVTGGRGEGGGAAVITSTAPISLNEILSSTNAGEPAGESMVAAVEDTELAVEYSVPVDTVGGVDSGIALYNPGTAPATVTLQVLDGTGAAAGHATLTLGRQRRVMVYALDGPLHVPAGFRGTLDVTSTSALAGVALRRNPASPVPILMPATNQVSQRMTFYLPRIDDGSSASGIAKTLFLLTNVSTHSATAKLTFSRDDGTAWPVSIAGTNSNGTFQTTIAPGATSFLTTGGAAALASGSAGITSDQPIGVAAVLIHSTSSGSLLSEVSTAPSPMNFQVLLPFDNTGQTAASAVFLNASAAPLTVNLDLLDSDGSKLGSTQMAPLPGGARVTGLLSDYFPQAAHVKGSVRASTSMQPFLSVLTFRQSAAGAMLSGGPAVPARLVPAGTPATVSATLDMAHQASASIGPSGGTLQVNDAQGNRYTLTIPANALITSSTIVMTAVSSAAGFPAPGLLTGVQLEPDGLVLLQPATLKIDLAGPEPAGVYPVGWRGSAPGIYANTPLPDTTSLTLTLSHFSGAGLSGADLTHELLAIDNTLDYTMSLESELAGQARQYQLLGMTQEAEAAKAELLDLFVFAYDYTIAPFMELALSSGDTDIMTCAVQWVLQYERQRELWGLSGDPDSDPVSGQINSFVLRIYDVRMQKLLQRCQNHDPTAYFELVTQYRQDSLIGKNTIPDMASLIDTINNCLPKVELDYNSEITGVFVAGDHQFNWDAYLHGSLVANGQLDTNVLNGITDPAQDLYAHFTVSGNHMEKYDPLKFTLSNSAPCTVSSPSDSPGLMSIWPGQDPMTSEVKYQFEPHYDPLALDEKGQQLCTFCPVYRKAPVQVQLVLNPGLPSEQVKEVCPDGTTTITENFWLNGWIAFHNLESFITSWDLVGSPDLLADKSFSATTTANGITFTEKTDLQLLPCSETPNAAAGTCTEHP